MPSDRPPKYIRLKKEIMGWILTGKIKPHEQLPPETKMAEDFIVSRHTVRLSLNELVHEGWLYRIRGKGTFCAEQCYTRIHQTLDVNIHGDA